MGLVRYGIGITEISGNAGGLVFARNKSGAYVRNRTKPVNPNSERQAAAKTVLGFLAEYWHTELTVVQRGLWETYAAAVAMKNRLGETIHLSGYNHFMRSSCAMRNYFAGQVDAAPTVLSLPEKDPTLLCSEETIAAQTFTFTFDVAGWAANGDNKMRMFIYQGQPQLVSRQTFHGPYRFMHAVTQIEGAAGTATAAAAYAFALGQKVWFQARMFTTSGRLSEPWQTPSRTVEADP